MCLIMKRYIILDAWYYIRGLFLIFILDSLIIDDEPLWEPLEWSLVQTWILFFFIFAWAAEVIFSSRYGSYTNRDKIVWMGLYKVYYLFGLWFFFNILITTIFITLPFYYEITYSISYLVLWWNWYNSIFFYKFTTLLSFIMILLNTLKFAIRWKLISYLYIIFTAVLFILFYLLYFNFITIAFAFFTDVNEYKQHGWMNLSRLTHGPLKWSWGLNSRDHFSYHRTPTVFWYKNDPQIAASMLFLNIFIFLSLFTFILKIAALIRSIYSSGEISHNLVTLLCSTFKHFYYFILSISAFVVVSLIYHFVRFPYELYWFTRLSYLFSIQTDILYDIVSLIL